MIPNPTECPRASGGLREALQRFEASGHVGQFFRQRLFKHSKPEIASAFREAYTCMQFVVAKAKGELITEPQLNNLVLDWLCSVKGSGADGHKGAGSSAAAAATAGNVAGSTAAAVKTNQQ